MHIGIPKEVKAQEHRVGLMPAGVQELVSRGHRVQVQTGAGHGVDITDEAYQQAGAQLIDEAASIFADNELIIKVKEPLTQEYGYLRSDQVLFTFLHLAADRDLTTCLLQQGCTAIGYETVIDRAGQLPLLKPMSEVAGRLSVQVGAHFLEKAAGGRGVLLGGVPGVAPADVMVLGGGIVGTEAVRLALGLQARVTVLDRSLERLKWLQDQFGGGLTTLYATQDAIQTSLRQADLVIGAVLRAGGAAPKLIQRTDLAEMKSGSVLVDVAIDQGGCASTSRVTSHEAPTFVVDGVIHYGVTNLPGMVPLTSTQALNHATLPFIIELAEHGLDALRHDPYLRAGLNTHRGQVTHAALAHDMDLPYVSAEEALEC